MKFLNKILKNQRFKMITILFFLLILYTFFCAFSYAQNVSSDLANSVFRLHVIANNDSKEDQDLKYKVRDNLIEYMNNISENCNSKEEVINLAQEHLNDFKKIAEDTIRDNGFDYDVNIEIGNFEFPTKNYGDISLPAGFYDALRVKIGNASGQNWWCVMFPPLCFIDVSSGVVPDESKEDLQDSMSEEDYAIISETDDTEMKFKFKILEFFTNSGLITAKK